MATSVELQPPGLPKTAKTPAQTICSILRYRRGVPRRYDRRLQRNKEMLYRVLNLRTTVAFIGSGCSASVGMPDWYDLAREAVLFAWVSLKGVSERDDGRKDEYEEQLDRFARKLEARERDLSRFFRELERRHGIQRNQPADSEPETRLPIDRDSYGNRLDEIATRLQIKDFRVYSPTSAQEDPPKLDIPGDQLRFILGACDRICKWSDSRRDKDSGRLLFHFWLAERFANYPPSGSNVHGKLLDLPFHRFITSNYDLILEQCLARKLGVNPNERDQLEEFLSQNAFTQKDQNSGKLARFAAGVSDDSRNMVFHCHGWSREADSMIVTEEDYQRWYLSEDHNVGGAFRQTLGLLVGSHPILFIGFGMNDPDLLMALRSLSAREPHLKEQRSLFALLPDSEAKDKDGMERLYDQFGVHVIGFPIEKGDRSRALVYCLVELRNEWGKTRESWLLKPRIHEAKVWRDKREYWHYKLKIVSNSGADKRDDTAVRSLSVSKSSANNDDSTALLTVKPIPSATDLNKLVATVTNPGKDSHVIVLVGPGGSGKSWFASQMLLRLKKNSDGNKFRRFFWSSYYADDALTGIIRANKFFLDAQKREGLSRLEAFAEILKSPGNILVFDGIERFLRPEKDQPDIGSAANSDVKGFLDGLVTLHSEGNLQSTLVLTSRLLPRELAPATARFFSVIPMTAQDAQHDTTLVPRDEQAALVALLEGHRYAMELARCWVVDENKNIVERVRKLIRLLSDVGPLRRVERMIELTLRKLDKDEDLEKTPGTGPYQLLMKRLALFMGAIKRDSTFKYCHKLSREEWKDFKYPGTKGIKQFPKAEEMWKALADNNLLFAIDEPGPSAECVMHAIVREFVFHHQHGADARNLASFTEAGFTSGVSMVDPGREGAKIIEQLFLEIRDECRDAYDKDRNAVDEKGKQKLNFDAAQELCQQAFGVLRSRMLANTVARWGSYAVYIHYLVRMCDLVRAYCGKRQENDEDRTVKRPKDAWLFWNRCDPALYGTKENPVIDENGPLFGDELAWLYHELGLALYHEGAMIDCISVWEQGLVVNQFLDGSRPGQYTFQAYCNLGAACIQYGRLPSAREYLQRAKEISVSLAEKDHLPRLNGYLALVRHLRGDLALADEEYKDALMSLAKTGNVRAECIFQRHRADLKLKMKDRNEAEKLIRSCRAKAEEGHFPDLVAHARLSEGHLYRALGKYQDAIREYNIALRDAIDHNMRALEADVQCEMARLALDLGDTETARLRAIKSLKTANELHLGLRQTHGLVVLGRATIEAGQFELGVGYLRLAKDLAARQHYELRAREAEEELHRLHAA